MMIATLIVLVIVLALLFAAIGLLMNNRFLDRLRRRGYGRRAINDMVRHCLNSQSLEEVIANAAETAVSVFSAQRCVVVDCDVNGTWWARSLNPGNVGRTQIQAHLRHLFGWFRTSPTATTQKQLAKGGFGAMRAPLRELMAATGCEALVPLASTDRLFCVLGISSVRNLDTVDQELLQLYRQDLSLSCANVSNYERAAEVIAMAHEVTLARDVELARIPLALAGHQGDLTWEGHYHGAESAGSDFFGIYPLADNRCMVVIGDAIGQGLAGTMVSAVLKSCCDTIFENRPRELNPGQLLEFLNSSLYRATKPPLAACFVALIDTANAKLYYANAGHTRPFLLPRDSQQKLTSLLSTGALLGDLDQSTFMVHSTAFKRGDTLAFLSNGVPMAEDRERNTLGEKRLREILASKRGAKVGEVCEALVHTVEHHRGIHPAIDDETLLVVQFA